MDWIRYAVEIEKCPLSFHVGRRNSDLVNWGIAYIALNSPSNASDLVKTFAQLVLTLDAGQQTDLADYDWIGKLYTVFEYYGTCSEDELENLLIDVEY